MGYLEGRALNSCLQFVSKDVTRDVIQRGHRSGMVCKEWLTFVDTRTGKRFRRCIRYLTDNYVKNTLPENQVIKYAGYWISVACIKEKKV